MHGANPGEQDLAQNFTVDLEIEIDVIADELDQTADYEKLANLVKEHISNNSYKLIETMAYNIASEIGKMDKVIIVW